MKGSVLGGVEMQDRTSFHLNFSVQEMPGQKLERDHPVVRQVEQVDRVDHLLRRYNQIYHLQKRVKSFASEVLMQSPDDIH